MAETGKRITQLGKAAATAKQGVFAIVDPITDKTVQLAVQAALGATRASMDWQSDTTYATDDFVLFNGLTAWKSLQNSNTGHTPTEGAWWTSQTISPADGITDTQHQNGLFTYEDSKIIYNDAQYYLQIASPYESTDIGAEIIAGDWAGPVAVAQAFVDFIPQDPEPSYNEGRVFYHDVKKNYVFMNDRSAVRMDVGRELWTRSVNKTVTGTTNGKAVYVTGSANSIPNVDLAKADVEATSNPIGLFTEDVAIDGNGEVTSFGLVNDVDTDSWTAGDVLYLSETTAGELTNTKPVVPNLEVPMGIVVKKHASEGIIWVNVGHVEEPIHRSINSAWSAFSGSISATNYLKGYYTFEGTSFTPSGSPQTLGTANIAYDGHVYFVLGASSTDMVVRVSGTSYDDTTGRTGTDTEDIDTSGGSTDDYYETSKKWIGQVSITLQSGTGVIVDYGWSSYWDNRNTKFVVSSIEWVGRAGANDSAPNIRLWHHKLTGWTYTGSGATPPTALVDMQSEYVTEYQFSNGEYFKFKKIGISQLIDGTGSEGIIIGIDITANNAVANSNVEIQIIGS